MGRRGRTNQLAKTIEVLLQRLLIDNDGLALWGAIQETCAQEVDALSSELYLHDQSHQVLRQLVRRESEEVAAQVYELADSMALPDDHPAVRALRSHGVIEWSDEVLPATDGIRGLAVPMYGQPNPRPDLDPLAVILFRFDFAHLTPQEWHHRRSFVTNSLLAHIWPVCSYANMRRNFPPLDGPHVFQLELKEVYREVMDTLCHRLGFEFATISIVDENAGEIRTEYTGTICEVDPQHWISDAHHPLSSDDIQAQVVAHGELVVIKEWEDCRGKPYSLDRKIWNTHKHNRLIRVFVPLGRIGTIEAGYQKKNRRYIEPLLIDVLTRYAVQVTVAIQNALLYEREQQHNKLLSELHKLSYEVQTKPPHADERVALATFVKAARTILDADLVALYPLEDSAPTDRLGRRFPAPILSDRALGKGEPGAPSPDSVVAYIAESGKPYYQPNVETDPRLGSFKGAQRSFTSRQHICSFAGVPLMARGHLVGVLCVNYRKRRQFAQDYERNRIELVAQQAAALLTSARYVREQERKRLETELHDRVKSQVSGLLVYAQMAATALETQPQSARLHIDSIKYGAREVLREVDLILDSPSATTSQPLRALFLRRLARLRAVGSPPLIGEEVDGRFPTVPGVVTHNIVSIMEEAVRNARQHARAQTIRVSLCYLDGQLCLVVEDDGVGFVPPNNDARLHCGLAGMRARARRLGGTFVIEPAVQSGTRIRVTVPYEEESGDG